MLIPESVEPRFSRAGHGSDRRERETGHESGYGYHPTALPTVGPYAIPVPGFSLCPGTALSVMATENPHPSEKGTTGKVLRTFTREPRPESGLDCLIGAIFARQMLQSVLASSGTESEQRGNTLQGFTDSGER